MPFNYILVFSIVLLKFLWQWGFLCLHVTVSTLVIIAPVGKKIMVKLKGQVSLSSEIICHSRSASWTQLMQLQ